MNLEEAYLRTIAEMKESSAESLLIRDEIISCIDLTLLDENADDEALNILSAKATRHQVAALCVLPQHLKKMPHSNEVKLATVVNFPEGNQSTEQILSLLKDLVTTQKIDEIDYVFPYRTYLGGEQQAALLQCQQVYQLCQQQSLCFKVILETGALPSLESIYQLSTEVLGQGCDFLKTSTGKIPQGATPAAAFVLLKAIKDSGVNCGLKVSGGIKKPEQAFLYANLARLLFKQQVDKSWFRIGASSLLDELIQSEQTKPSDLRSVYSIL